MSEEAAASNAAGESVSASVETTNTEVDTAVQQQEQPSATTREALTKAFTKVSAPVEASTAETAPKTDDKARDPATGQFAKKTEQEPKLDTKLAQPPATETLAAPQLVAPQRFTKAAQAEWNKVPEVVRQETERAFSELTQGIEKYKVSAESFEPVRKFDEIARKSGTTLADALDAYYGIEMEFKSQNPLNGFLRICQNLGFNPQQVGQALLGVQPGQMPAPQQRQQAPQDPPQIKEITDRLNKFEQTLQQKEASAVIERFASDPAHPYFDELADSISHMLETKFAKDLQDAYDKAVRLNPEIAAKIEADNAAKAAPKIDTAAQTREKANKSITGTPNAGSNPSRKPAGSAREALKGAFAQVGLNG